MPHYDYACKYCGHELEVFQRMTDAPLKKCPACKRMGLVRQIGIGAGIIFKGSGFYETDYKANSKKPKETSEKSESKPEKKKEESSKASKETNAKSD